jgi:hypothetical protein
MDRSATRGDAARSNCGALRPSHAARNGSSARTFDDAASSTRATGRCAFRSDSSAAFAECAGGCVHAGDSARVSRKLGAEITAGRRETGIRRQTEKRTESTCSWCCSAEATRPAELPASCAKSLESLAAAPKSAEPFTSKRATLAKSALQSAGTQSFTESSCAAGTESTAAQTAATKSTDASIGAKSTCAKAAGA